jgi:hypothetical protein
MLSPLVGDEEVDPQSDAFCYWIVNLTYDGKTTLPIEYP